MATPALSQQANAQQIGAQQASPPSPANKAVTQALPDSAQLDALIKTIQDPAERDKLVGQLKALSAAENQGQPEADEPDLLDLLSDQLTQAEADLSAALRNLPSFHYTWAWAKNQAGSETERARWFGILWRLAAVLGGGIVADLIVCFLLRLPLRSLRKHAPRNRWLRLPVAILVWVINLVPVFAFFLTANFLLGSDFLKPERDAFLAAGLLITGYALVRGALSAARAILAPDSPEMRPLPIDDESANYLTIWAKRLIHTEVWGYFIIRALWMLGLPHGGYEALLKLLQFMVALMLVILVLQNRQIVGDWIRSRRARIGMRGSAGLAYLRNRLADIWHILAVLYILADFLVWALRIKGGFDYLARASLLTVVVLIGARLVGRGGRHLIEKAFSLSGDLRTRYPHLEIRANRYLQLMHTLTQGLIGVIAVLVLLQVWGAGTLAFLSSDLGRKLVSTVVTILVVIVVTLIVWELIGAAIERAIARSESDASPGARRARAKTVLPLVRHLLTIVLAVIAGLIVLSEVGLNIAPMLAGAGVVGVAIGFGAQKMVQEIITGAFLLFDDTMAVGDVVKIGEFTGMVEGLTIRAVRLRDGNGSLHTIPFSGVTNISNMTRDYSYYQFNIGVSYKADVDQVIATIKDVAETMRGEPEWAPLITAEVEMWGVDKFADSSVIVAGRIKTLPVKQWLVGREFNRRIKKRFDEDGIEIAYPSTTLFFGDTKQAEALHDRLQLENKSAEAAGPQPDAEPDPEPPPSKPRASRSTRRSSR